MLSIKLKSVVNLYLYMLIFVGVFFNIYKVFFESNANYQLIYIFILTMLFIFLYLSSGDKTIFFHKKSKIVILMLIYHGVLSFLYNASIEDQMDYARHIILSLKYIFVFFIGVIIYHLGVKGAWETFQNITKLIILFLTIEGVVYVISLNYGFGIYEYQVSAGSRFSSAFVGNNMVVGFWGLVGIVISFLLKINNKNWIMYMLFSIFVILLTQERSIYLSVFVFFLSYILLGLRYYVKKHQLFIVAFFLLMLTVVMLEYIYAMRPEYGDSLFAFYTRLYLYANGLELAYNKLPIGTGAGMYLEYSYRYDTYFALMMDSYLQGLNIEGLDKASSRLYVWLDNEKGATSHSVFIDFLAEFSILGVYFIYLFVSKIKHLIKLAKIPSFSLEEKQEIIVYVSFMFSMMISLNFLSWDNNLWQFVIVLSFLLKRVSLMHKPFLIKKNL